MRYIQSRFIVITIKLKGNYMSNNNSPKPAMMAVVSAAQKSVNNTQTNNTNNNQNVKNNSVANNTVANNTATPEKNIPLQAQLTQETQSSVTTQKNSAYVTPKTTTTQPQQKINTQSEQAVLKKSADTVNKTQEEILKSATQNLKKISDPAIKSSETPVSNQKNTDFNHHIVSILCDGIRNIHNQSSDFSEQLRQRREIKQKSLAEIQTITCDNIHALSNTCIDAVKTSLQNKNPIDIIHNQTKAITEIQKIYSNMFSTISKASAEIVKQNYNFSWFNQNKK